MSNKCLLISSIDVVVMVLNISHENDFNRLKKFSCASEHYKGSLGLSIKLNLTYKISRLKFVEGPNYNNQMLRAFIGVSLRAL